MARPEMAHEEVLLTGFPSFCARRMLDELLLSRTTEIHAVVRRQVLDQASLLLAQRPSEERERIHVLEGDTSFIDLGLSGAEFRDLTPRVDRIYHLADANFAGVEREFALSANVKGAREIIEFAEACKNLACLLVHSTAAVSGTRTGHVREEDLFLGQSFRNVVEETKARAERMFREAMPRIPIAVARPSIIIGGSETGEIDRLDGPYLLILLMMTSPAEIALPLPGRGDAPLNLVPIDFVVRAERAISLDDTAPGRTFHVVDRESLTARRTFELIAEASGKRSPRGFIPANLTKAILRTPGLDRFARSPRAFIDALGANVTYDTTNADELLRRAGVTCPPFASYVDVLVEYIDRRLRRQRERSEEVVDALDPL